MRTTVLCALFAVVAGVSMTKGTAGHTMLLEIQQQVEAGLPLDQINATLKAVGDRIVGANTSDTAQHDDFVADCAAQKATHEAAIEAARAEITRLKAEIKTNEGLYEEARLLGKQLVAEIDQLEVDIQGIMAEIERKQNERDVQHAQFVNRSTDTTSVIAAIESIKGVQQGSTLKELFPDADSTHTEAREAEEAKTAALTKHADGDDEAQAAGHVADRTEATEYSDASLKAENNVQYQDIDNYKLEGEITANEDYTQTAFLQLTALANKAASPTTAALLQTAAKATAAMSGEDYEAFMKLLDELLEELRVHTEEIIKAEKVEALDFAKWEAISTNELRTAQAAKGAKQQQLMETLEKKRDLAATVDADRASLDIQSQERENQRQLLADSNAECAMADREFKARVADRDEQMKTLAEIAHILVTKIGEKMNANDRLKNTVRTTASPTAAPAL